MRSEYSIRMRIPRDASPDMVNAALWSARGFATRWANREAGETVIHRYDGFALSTHWTAGGDVSVRFDIRDSKGAA